MPPPVIPSLNRALTAVGQLLAARGERVAIVIVGGAALNLLGYVRRPTQDVDVLALASGKVRTPRRLKRPDPLPEALREAVRTVARDLGLGTDWLNTGPASQWETGLPPGVGRRVRWRRYGGLRVGLAGRRDLIFLKLYAAADAVGPQSVHFQDLLRLRPTKAELAAAAKWAAAQDPSPAFRESLAGLLRHVTKSR